MLDTFNKKDESSSGQAQFSREEVCISVRMSSIIDWRR